MSDPLAVMQRIRQGGVRREVPAEERCELCAEPIPAEHGHLVDLGARQLRCACRGCYLLFVTDGAGGARFRAVPDRYLALDDFALSPAQWDAFCIPVGVAFFFENSSLGRVTAFYPGPAGATESELPLDAWEEIATGNPVVAGLATDVEALLVRVDPRASRIEGYVVPIDACYELVGHLRRQWRGFDGGAEARDQLDAFFADVAARAR